MRVQPAGIRQHPDDALADLFLLPADLCARAIERRAIRADPENGDDFRSEFLHLFDQRFGAAQKLVFDRGLREKLSANARRAVESRDWDEAFQEFWSMSAE